MLTLITRGREYYASELAGNGPCVAVACVTLAPASVSASAAEASLQVQEVLLMCFAGSHALCDLNGLIEEKAAFLAACVLSSASRHAHHLLYSGRGKE